MVRRAGSRGFGMRSGLCVGTKSAPPYCPADLVPDARNCCLPVQHEACYINLQFGLVGIRMTKTSSAKIATWSAMSPWVEFAKLAQKSNSLAHENKTFTLGLS
jgi:hypothetical protein